MKGDNMNDRQMNHYMMIISIVAIVAIFGLIAFIVSFNTAGEAYLPTNSPYVSTEVTSYPDENGGTSYEGLRDCEVVSEIIEMDVVSGGGYRGHHKYYCPLGKIPITNSLVPIRIPGESTVIHKCSNVRTSSGGHTFTDGGGQVFHGMEGTIQYESCVGEYTVAFEASMVCCTP